MLRLITTTGASCHLQQHRVSSSAASISVPIFSSVRSEVELTEKLVQAWKSAQFPHLVEREYAHNIGDAICTKGDLVFASNLKAKYHQAHAPADVLVIEVKYLSQNVKKIEFKRWKMLKARGQSSTSAREWLKRHPADQVYKATYNNVEGLSNLELVGLGEDDAHLSDAMKRWMRLRWAFADHIPQAKII